MAFGGAWIVESHFPFPLLLHLRSNNHSIFTQRFTRSPPKLERTEKHQSQSIKANNKLIMDNIQVAQRKDPLTSDPRTQPP